MATAREPVLIDAPKDGGDPLTKVVGIGKPIHAALNDLGVYTFDQVASWSPENIVWLEQKLGLKGRIKREKWMAQAVANGGKATPQADDEAAGSKAASKSAKSTASKKPAAGKADEKPKAESKPKAAAKSAATPASSSGDDKPSLDDPKRPSAMEEPADGADDLELISGVGPKLEKLLYSLGIYKFSQIAEWDADNVEWMDGYLSFKGRIDRDDWIGQCKAMAAAGDKPSLDDPNRPAHSDEPDGGGDNLEDISGIGPKLNGLLKSLGIHIFKQIAEWSPENVDWIDGYLSFKGRVEREQWIEQAKALIAGKPSLMDPRRPNIMETAPAGGADDLKKISGVGPKLSDLLNSLGIFTFAQVAEWNKDNIEWVDDYLSFKGRIERDDWIGQAKSFSEGGGD